MLTTLVGLGSLYLFFKIVVPVLILAAIIYFAYRALNPASTQFSSGEYRPDLDEDELRGPRL